MILYQSIYLKRTTNNDKSRKDKYEYIHWIMDIAYFFRKKRVKYSLFSSKGDKFGDALLDCLAYIQNILLHDTIIRRNDALPLKIWSIMNNCFLEDLNCLKYLAQISFVAYPPR